MAEKIYRVTARSGLKVRCGPGTNYEESADPVPFGCMLIGADGVDTGGDWLPILLEDDEVAYVFRQWTELVEKDYRSEELLITTPDTQITKSPIIFQKNLLKLFGYPRDDASYLKITDLREFSDQLSHVRDFQGNKWSCRIWGHEALEQPLITAFRLLKENNLLREFKTYDGCFCIRQMKGGNSPSVHSYGLALDFNAATNPFSKPNYSSWPRLITDFSKNFVKCFAEAGFEWGGLWQSCHDAMHFQIPWTQDWRNSDNPLAPKS